MRKVLLHWPLWIQSFNCVAFLRTSKIKVRCDLLTFDRSELCVWSSVLTAAVKHSSSLPVWGRTWTEHGATVRFNFCNLQWWDVTKYSYSRTVPKYKSVLYRHFLVLLHLWAKHCTVTVTLNLVIFKILVYLMNWGTKCPFFMRILQLLELKKLFKNTLGLARKWIVTKLDRV